MTLGFMIMRAVAKEVYGYVSVQVALYMSLSMFFAKEAVRKAVIRELGDNRSMRSSFNLMQLTLLINLLLMVLVTCYIIFFTESASELQYFVPSMLLYAGTIVLQCYLEAYYVYMVFSKDLTPRLTLESIGVFIKTGLLYLMLTQEMHLLAYAASEFIYELFLLVGYPLLIARQPPKLETAYLPPLAELRVVTALPVRETDNEEKSYFAPYVLDTHAELLADFTKASLLKFVLQEGEKIFMVMFAAQLTNGSEDSLKIQAEFALVANFLGMLVQLMFAPAEETALILFSSRKEPDLPALQFWL